MATLLEELQGVDENIGSQEVFQLVSNGQYDASDILHAIKNLTGSPRLRIAFMLAMMMANANYKHEIIYFALSIGGMLFNSPEEEKRGLKALWSAVDQLSDEQQKAFFDNSIFPASIYVLEKGLRNSDHDLVLRFLEITKAADPPLRPIFDWDAPVPQISIEKMRQQGRERANLFNHPIPPTGLPRQQRRVLVTGRETFFQRGANSRLLDIGPRIASAMVIYGWQAELHIIGQKKDECRLIAERCRLQKLDVLVLDDEVLGEMRQAYIDMILQVRRDNPSIKIVGYRLDAWEINLYQNRKQTLITLSSYLDLVWDFDMPSLPIWKEPAFANKMLCMPCPFAWDQGTSDKPLTPHMLFSGSVKAFNWHRAFWMSAIERMKLPVTTKVSTHRPDGLPPLESYSLYMQGLMEATCCLNLVMRPDHHHSRIATGRSFETLLSGSLLVQEMSREMDYFFIPGEHYLEFSSVAELAAIVRFIDENREEAEAIRQRGHTFAREYYSDKRLIGFLDKALFFPD